MNVTDFWCRGKGTRKEKLKVHRPSQLSLSLRRARLWTVDVLKPKWKSMALLTTAKAEDEERKNWKFISPRDGSSCNGVKNVSSPSAKENYVVLSKHIGLPHLTPHSALESINTTLSFTRNCWLNWIRQAARQSNEIGTRNRIILHRKRANEEELPSGIGLCRQRRQGRKYSGVTGERSKPLTSTAISNDPAGAYLTAKINWLAIKVSNGKIKIN